MILPTTNKELQLIRIGHKYIAGVDEVGRGPLAGPVVAGVVMFNWEERYNCDKQCEIDDREKILDIRNWILEEEFKLVRDSKTLSENQRIKLYKWLIGSCFCWSVGIVSQEEIDRIGIRNASLAAMAEAINSLPQKPDIVLVDGRDTIESINIYQEPVIKGDRDVFSIAAASIIAKVTRDEIMKKYGEVFPQYGFAEHKGYGTAGHYENLEMFGECRLHRKSFRLETDLHG